MLVTGEALKMWNARRIKKNISKSLACIFLYLGHFHTRICVWEYVAS